MTVFIQSAMTGYSNFISLHFYLYQPKMQADIDKNGSVDFYDLAELATVWLYDGSIGVKRADLNLDGKIDFADFSLLASDWYGELN